MSHAVEVSGLRKSYGRVHAVRDVGFTVGYGEIVALLGPNGAGKTTTLEILEGFRTRDGGTAEVLGYDPGERSSARELRERTGLVLQDIAVEPYLTVRETIARAAGYYRAPRGVAEAGLLAHCVLVSVIDIALIVVVGRLYGVPFPSHWLAIMLTLVLGAASFCALGVAVASVISNAEAAPAVAQLVLFPLMFISGTYLPIHSALLNQVSGWLPVRPFNEALTGPFAQHAGAGWRDLAVLAAWGVAGAIVAVRRFRWDPRPE